MRMRRRIATGISHARSALTSPLSTAQVQLNDKAPQTGGQRDQSAPKIVLTVDRVGGGDYEVEDEQRHGHCKDAVTQRGEALDASAGKGIVGGEHRQEV